MGEYGEIWHYNFSQLYCDVHKFDWQYVVKRFGLYLWSRPERLPDYWDSAELIRALTFNNGSGKPTTRLRDDSVIILAQVNHLLCDKLLFR